LSQGSLVTLVSTTPDGLTQTVTFTPAGTMSAIDIARTLETARQQLISRGVATPNALQIGTTLAGGTLTTPGGTVQVPTTVATITPGGVAPNASTGATVPRLGATNPTSNLSVTTQPSTTGTTSATGGATANAGTTAGTTGGTTGGTTLGTTAGGTTLGTTAGTTTSTAPSSSTSTGTGNTGTPASPGVVFSGPSPIFTTTPSPTTTSPNGPPAPAVQMQGHR
jgi:hypothetical protein